MTSVRCFLRILSKICILLPWKNKLFREKWGSQSHKYQFGSCTKGEGQNVLRSNHRGFCFFLSYTQDLLAQFGIRSPFTLNQRQSLDNAYLENKYPSNEEKKELASSLGISVKQVTIWFQNRRQKDKAALP